MRVYHMAVHKCQIQTISGVVKMGVIVSLPPTSNSIFHGALDASQLKEVIQ